MDDLIEYLIQYQSHNVVFEGAIYYNMVKETGGKRMLTSETVFPADLFTQ